MRWASTSSRQNTPPPGISGGLLNAIYGSFIMTLMATLVGTPFGIMAGTYLAEYAREQGGARRSASSTTSC